MYERFTDRARKVMQLANQEAQRFNHEYIGTEHVLLGLIKEGSGVAAHALKNLGVDPQKIEAAAVAAIEPGDPDSPSLGKLPQTPRVKAVVEFAKDEAVKLHHHYVGTEHLLLGLIREQDGVGAQSLMASGVSLQSVRDAVVQLLSLPESANDAAAIIQRCDRVITECGNTPGLLAEMAAATSDLREVVSVSQTITVEQADFLDAAEKGLPLIKRLNKHVVGAIAQMN